MYASARYRCCSSANVSTRRWSYNFSLIAVALVERAVADASAAFLIFLTVQDSGVSASLIVERLDAIDTGKCAEADGMNLGDESPNLLVNIHKIHDALYGS